MRYFGLCGVVFRDVGMSRAPGGGVDSYIPACSSGYDFCPWLACMYFYHTLSNES